MTNVLWLALAFHSADSGPIPELYDRVAPAVVGLRCIGAPRNEYFGTGTIIDPSGLVITSITVVPKDASGLKVTLSGGRELDGRVVLVDPAKELTLLRILSTPEREFPWVPLGDSSDTRVGEPALSFGNAFRSIETDGLVTLGAGVVSGVYALVPTFSESKYAGSAIETSAHVNGGMDGGPLIDSKGRLIGVLCLNYSRSRWLGTAVPINDLKPLIARERDWLKDDDGAFQVFVGLELEHVAKKTVRVLRVKDNGPAALAGLRGGEELRSIQGQPVSSLETFRDAFSKARPGDRLRVEALRGAEPITVEILLWGKL